MRRIQITFEEDFRNIPAQIHAFIDQRTAYVIWQPIVREEKSFCFVYTCEN